MDVTIATVDIVLGTMLAYLLSRSRSGFRNTDSMINRLIVYTVASGLPHGGGRLGGFDSHHSST